VAFTIKVVNDNGPSDTASRKIGHIALHVISNNLQVTSIRRYCKHMATQTDSCQLLAHVCMVWLKLYLVDLLTTYYTNKSATNSQQIKMMELEP